MVRIFYRCQITVKFVNEGKNICVSPKVVSDVGTPEVIPVHSEAWSSEASDLSILQLLDTTHLICRIYVCRMGWDCMFLSFLEASTEITEIKGGKSTTSSSSNHANLKRIF